MLIKFNRYRPTKGPTMTTTAPTAPEATTPVDPWAFLPEATESTDLETVKKAPLLADIPMPIRAMCERALTEAKVLKIRFPDEKTARECVKFVKAYALAREATTTAPIIVGGKVTKTIQHTGPVTVRAVPQNDKKIVHLTVKVPSTPTPTPVIPSTNGATPAEAVEAENVRQAKAQVKANNKDHK